MFQNLFNESNLSINLIIAVDNITIDYTNDGKLEVKDGGISTVKIANLAVTNAKINDMDAAKLTGTITIPIDNVSIQTDRIFVSDQNASTPSITFKNDQNTGFFRYGADQIGVSIGGNHFMTIGPSRVYIYYGGMEVYDNLVNNGNFYLNLGDFHLGSGSIMRIDYTGPVSYPTLTFGDPTNGFYYSGTNTISLKTNNIEILRMLQTEVECFTNFKALSLSATGTISGDNIICNTLQSVSNVTVGGNLIIPIGSSSAPSLHFAGDSTTGIYRNAAVTLSITSNSTETARFNYSQIQFFAPLAMGSNTINCGAITSSGAFNNGANTVTCGAITSSGAFDNGANSISCGSGFINGPLLVGKSSPAITTGYNKLQLYGTNANSAGPHLQAFTNTDNYPLSQLYNWQHDNVALNFDCYYDGSWRSSDIGSNFSIYKLNDFFSINYGTGVAQGSTISGFTTNRALIVNTSGQVNIPRLFLNNNSYSLNGHGRIQIFGQASATANSPSILHCFNGDNYPVMNIMPFTHDEMEISFDCYRMPSAGIRSSSVNSNFKLGKYTTTFTLDYASGVALGDLIGWTVGLQLNTAGQVSIGRSIINTGAQKLMIYGTNNSANGPHIQTFTSADNYPLLQAASLAHNNVLLGFDTYHDGTTYRSSDSGSNFVLGKVANSFQVLIGTGAAQGTVPTMTVASSWSASGNFTCNYPISGTSMSLSSQPCLMMSASSYMSVSDATATLFTGFDTSDYSSGSISHVSGVFTVPSTGVYLITFEMAFDGVAMSTGVLYRMWIAKNGSGRYGQQTSRTTNIEACLSSSCQLRLIANDTIELYVYQNSGGNCHIGTLVDGIGRIEITKLF